MQSEKLNGLNHFNPAPSRPKRRGVKWRDMEQEFKVGDHVRIIKGAPDQDYFEFDKIKEGDILIIDDCDEEWIKPIGKKYWHKIENFELVTEIVDVDPIVEPQPPTDELHLIRELIWIRKELHENDPLDEVFNKKIKQLIEQL